MLALVTKCKALLYTLYAWVTKPMAYSYSAKVLSEF